MNEVPKQYRYTSDELWERLRRAPMAVYDYDGTLVDSAQIKAAAFEQAGSYLTTLDLGSRLREIHQASGSMSRTEQVHEFLGTLHHLVMDQIQCALEDTNPDLIPGVEQNFQRGHYSSSRWNLVVSGAPEDSVMLGLSRLRLLVHFAEVIGDANPKAKFLEALRLNAGIEPWRVAYFGDTADDVAQARQAGYIPILIGSKPFSEIEAPQFRDFEEFNRWILP